MAIPASMTDAFKKLKNTDIERMKKASVRAAHIGPGVPQNSLDTFRLLKQDPQLITMQESQRSAAKDVLSTKAELLVKQRDEFHKQIHDYNEDL